MTESKTEGLNPRVTCAGTFIGATFIGAFADFDPKQGAAIDHSIATGAPLFAEKKMVDISAPIVR